MKNITRAVWLLSIISLFTDMASEMLYPIMPIYLKSIGFSVVFIGVLEGIAEATAGLSKGYFGKKSDDIGRRVPFVQLGYGLSAISKPMLALFSFPLWVFFARTVDRFGKGIRTGARDAILSSEATPETKGEVFGLHRSMDTLGAVAGPALALLYLYWYPGQYKALFFIAFIPGILAFVSALMLKEKAYTGSKKKVYTPFFSFFDYWKKSPPSYRKLVAGFLAFALFNSSDAFLLLKIKEAGLSDPQVIGVYIFYNLVYALSAYPIGVISDKIGMKTIFITGLMLFSMVYLGMAIGGNLYFYAGLFFLYGLYAASTEGIAKAWISNISDPKETATAIGTFSGLQSICTMLASFMAGLVWYNLGATACFAMSAVAVLGAAFYLLVAVQQGK